VEWKIVTGNRQVTRKLKEFEKCAALQHQPEAYASDPGDDQSCYLLVLTAFLCLKNIIYGFCSKALNPFNTSCSKLLPFEGLHQYGAKPFKQQHSGTLALSPECHRRPNVKN